MLCLCLYAHHSTPRGDDPRQVVSIAGRRHDGMAVVPFRPNSRKRIQKTRELDKYQSG
ncbi:hypothetical protein KNP414_07415 [Paenibacillus mucilaginosus KNP414]|uniref:Uncharacterized protein n=1 Tax=Paenibacillus mucilaginosus (strain KNP414) TaxID=1036673 RepID=F8FPV2_PAEMK|nr:hypothetical protein KNP414_07415 [Paenibacillus mucilaginosus KNP414]